MQVLILVQQALYPLNHHPILNGGSLKTEILDIENSFQQSQRLVQRSPHHAPGRSRINSLCRKGRQNQK